MAFTDQEGGSGLEIERLVFFSDAVFAIAITLLVIDLKLPPAADLGSEREAWQALGATTPRLLGFVITATLMNQLQKSSRTPSHCARSIRSARLLPARPVFRRARARIPNIAFV